MIECATNGTLKARYTHGPGIDEPLAVQKGTKNYYYHADGLGSIVALSNSSAKAVQLYRYDAFGRMTQSGSVVQPYTYTAREYDTETALYYYRARYYDPKAGRFITRDPIGFKGGINQYAYVRNNPVNGTDPTGLFSHHLYLSMQAFEQSRCPKLYVMASNATQDIDSLPNTNDIVNSHWHAMRRPNETMGAAIGRTEAYITSNINLCNFEGLGAALHAEQDKYAGAHMGYQVWYGGLPSIQHWRADTFYSNTPGAIIASANLIKRFKEKCPCACEN
ncbi:MAG: repeat protein [Firmicutes bacterium]|nr:repeat protein [Bacillota bacterium]